MTTPQCQPQLDSYYIGPPGALVQLSTPDNSAHVVLDRGITDHDLINGGAASTYLERVRQQYVYSYNHRDLTAGDQIVSIYAGLLGIPPYYVVDPAFRNALSSQISSAGKTTVSTEGFVVTGGSVAYSSSIAPPAKAPLAGVLDWTTATNSRLWANASAANILQSSAPPVIPAEPATEAIWLKTASSTATVSIYAYCNSAAGAFTGLVALATGKTITTSWQRFGGTLAAGGAPANSVVLGWMIQVTSGSPPHLHVSANDLQYCTAVVDPADGPAAVNLPPWVLGLRVPKMIVRGQMPADYTKFQRRSLQLTLAEA